MYTGTFDGDAKYYTESDGTYSVATDVTEDNFDEKVEADARNNTVIYNANYAGADPATATETFALDGHPTGVSDAITALKTREGYTFEGWFDAATGGEEVTITELSASATVYAHWAEVPEDAAPSIETTAYTFSSGNAVEVTVSLGSGDSAATGITEITYVSPAGSTKTLATSNYSLDGNTLTFTADHITSLVTGSVTSRTYTVKFNDNDSTTVDLVFTAE